MERSQIRFFVRDDDGNVLQNARVYYYETGTTTALGDLYTTPTGGAPVTSIVSDSDGLTLGYITTARDIKVVITSNGGAAYYPADPGTPIPFSDKTYDPISVKTQSGNINSLIQTVNDITLTVSNLTLSGTFTTRPAAGTALRRYYATDQDIEYEDNGTDWVPVNVEPFDVRVFGAVGDGVTDDTTAIQAAIDSGINRLYFPTGTYRVENLNVSARETMTLYGDGGKRSILKLRDDDSLGGIGQIFILTDVIKAQIYELGFNGNYANAKAGSSGNPLVRYIQTSASAGRKDCVWDVQRCRFEESAKGWGHCRAGVYENSDDNLAAEFERVTLRDIVSLYHGTSAGAFNIRGPAQVVDIENIYVRNDGQYGMVTVGQASSIGSNKLPIGLSAEGGYKHFLRNVTIRNVTMYRTYGGIFLGMCSNPTIDGFFDFESCTNPYYDTAPIQITAVDVTNNKLTSAIPTTTDANNNYGTSSIVRFTTTGTLPGGLADNVLYFVKSGVVGNTFQVSTTSQSGTAVDITDAGTGTHSIQWLGYSFANSLKCDDNIWYADKSPGHIVVSRMVTAKSTPHTSHSSIGLESSIDYNGNAADNASVSSRITIKDSNLDSVVGINDAAANIMTEIENCVFEGGWIPPLGTVGATTTISSGNSSALAMLGGTIRDCIFGIVQIGNIVISPTRDLTIQNCRFRGGITISKTNNIVVQMINNLWNFGDVGDTIVEVTPPTTGNKGLLRMVGNHVPANAAFATKLRLTTGKDLSNFDVFLEDNDLTSDTGGVSDFGNAALRLTSVRNRNAARANSEFPRTTLAASATPAITGGTNLVTGSATAITNFTGGFEYQRIRVYVATGHQINNTANIVTRLGTNITGPAIAEFVCYGSVWREVGSPIGVTTPVVGTGLGTTGTVNLDFSTLNGTFQTIALTGDITFTTSNLAAGRSVTLFISAAATRTFTFPAWIFVGAVAPTSILAGKSGVLTLTSTTTANGGVYAAWAASP